MMKQHWMILAALSGLFMVGYRAEARSGIRVGGARSGPRPSATRSGTRGTASLQGTRGSMHRSSNAYNDARRVDRNTAASTSAARWEGSQYGALPREPATYIGGMAGGHNYAVTPGQGAVVHSKGGTVYKVPPQGSVPVKVGGRSYYRHGYHWYWPHYYGGSVRYEEVEPPPGALVEELPEDVDPVEEGSQTYYDYEGARYREVEGGYQVVGNGIGSPLPEDVLQSMCRLLGGLQAFSLSAVETADRKLPGGQLVEEEYNRKVLVQRPDRLAAAVRGGIDRRFWFDGSTITQMDRAEGVYGQIPYTGSIRGMLELLESKYAMRLPVAELVNPALYERLQPALEHSEYLGLAEVNKVMCHHLFFESADADWELWVSEGAEAAPAQLVIRYKGEQEGMRYRAVFKVEKNTGAFPASSFTFTPPADATLIDVLPIEDPS